MARTAQFTDEEIQKAQNLRDEARTVADFRKAMSVILSAKLGIDAIQISELLGISRSTLYEWIIQKKIPCIKVGRLVKFKKSDLEEWIRKRTQNEEKISIP